MYNIIFISAELDFELNSKKLLVDIVDVQIYNVFLKGIFAVSKISEVLGRVYESVLYIVYKYKLRAPCL